MSKHRTGKWSTRRKAFVSISILTVYVAGFLGLYFYMESTKEEQAQKKAVEEEASLEEEVKELLTHFYIDEERSEINEELDAEIHEAFNEKVELIQDEELKQALTLEAAFAIVFLYTQQQVRDALNDDEYLKELTAEDIESFDDAVLLAEEELPNFAEKIAPKIEEVKLRYAEIK